MHLLHAFNLTVVVIALGQAGLILLLVLIIIWQFDKVSSLEDVDVVKVIIQNFLDYIVVSELASFFDGVVDVVRAPQISLSLYLSCFIVATNIRESGIFAIDLSDDGPSWRVTILNITPVVSEVIVPDISSVVLHWVMIVWSLKMRVRVVRWSKVFLVGPVVAPAW